MLSQNQTAKNQRNQKVCNNQNLSQNQNNLIKKRLLVVHTQKRITRTLNLAQSSCYFLVKIGLGY